MSESLKDSINVKGTMLRHFSSLSNEKLELVYSWRTNPEISKWMCTCDFNLSAHFDFAKKLKTDKNRFYWLVSKDNVDIGVISLVIVSNGKIGELGIYSNPEIKGVGAELMYLVFEVGFKKLCLEVIEAHVYLDNKRAISLYEKIGMKINRDKVSSCGDVEPRPSAVYEMSKKYYSDKKHD
jgi:UDP-4-amino-4,6-dideoxy-N-acetyl-beta-L-altrosamine N-acetyltransferase